MTAIDCFLQKWRIRLASHCLSGELSLIDVGAHNGEMFECLGSRLVKGFGIEPLLASARQTDKYILQPGFFPAVRPKSGGWDAISMLAVLEHIPSSQQPDLANACWELLRPGGLIVITVPSPVVDHILCALSSLKLIDGMSLEEHFGFQPNDTKRIFCEPRFQLVLHRRFQFGLNHLFVFSKNTS